MSYPRLDPHAEASAELLAKARESMLRTAKWRSGIKATALFTLVPACITGIGFGIHRYPDVASVAAVLVIGGGIAAGVFYILRQIWLAIYEAFLIREQKRIFLTEEQENLR